MKGFIFGFIDNLIVAISAILGIHIENYFSGNGINGALYGALIGHTLSDMFAGYMDFGSKVAINMGIGCILVIIMVYVYNSFTKI
tara:strand:- start:160 stop:414 length:255 start_codon:yes stop_codon:yes gene_type:complete